jgi:hypothetical protein
LRACTTAVGMLDSAALESFKEGLVAADC